MAEQLKNYYDKSFITTLANALHKTFPDFHKSNFIQLVFSDKWNNKELKERMRHISICLHQVLPDNYKEAISVLLETAPLMNGISKHGGFLNMFFPDFVELYGQDDWKTSLLALEEFTKHSSSEFAVRPFIQQDSQRMMLQMKKWTRHENYHVRRLASEGCRPRLPWAMALPEFKKDPSLILPILHILKNDEKEYVRRSVANNLNDIAKDNPDVVIKIAKEWHGRDKVTDKLVKHACRTLLKAANKDVLAIFGFTNTDNVNVNIFKIDKDELKIGEEIIFFCTLDVIQPGKLRFEYAIDFMKNNGKTSRKIFQIKEGCYGSGKLSFNKKHSFKEMTTRKHYAGKHNLALVINGVEIKKVSFLLKSE
ncbi:MAG: DNA alkylation repair protein [Thiotrichales bacterium]|nr:MAG: DNA alkylation repair protein [Thiotrichales bacterium]